MQDGPPSFYTTILQVLQAGNPKTCTFVAINVYLYVSGKKEKDTICK